MVWFLLIISIIPCVVCLTMACWLCFRGRLGWGLFLFVALMLGWGANEGINMVFKSLL